MFSLHVFVFFDIESTDFVILTFVVYCTMVHGMQYRYTNEIYHLICSFMTGQIVVKNNDKWCHMIMHRCVNKDEKCIYDLSTAVSVHCLHVCCNTMRSRGGDHPNAGRICNPAQHDRQ